MLTVDVIKNLGGNGYVLVGCFLWCYFLGYVLFPNNAIHGFLIRVMDRLLMGGGRMKW